MFMDTDFFEDVFDWSGETWSDGVDSLGDTSNIAIDSGVGWAENLLSGTWDVIENIAQIPDTIFEFADFGVDKVEKIVEAATPIYDIVHFPVAALDAGLKEAKKLLDVVSPVIQDVSKVVGEAAKLKTEFEEALAIQPYRNDKQIRPVTQTYLPSWWLQALGYPTSPVQAAPAAAAPQAGISPTLLYAMVVVLVLVLVLK